jgi:16S rRNA (cytosine967-C5)-methyltransferase
MRIETEEAYSHIALDAALDSADLSRRDRGLATELVYGTLIWRRPIDFLLARHIDRPLEELDDHVHVALRMALYQIVYLDRVPDHAVVDEAVEIVKQHEHGGAAGFVNGVLRAMLRKRDQLDPEAFADELDDPVASLGLRYSLPDWIAARLIDAHGEERAREIADAYTERPLLYLRRLGDRDPRKGPGPIDFPDDMEGDADVPGGLVASEMSDKLRELLDSGRLAVQDVGSQIVGWMARPEPEQRDVEILDGCAGQGTKTLQLAGMLEWGGSVVAVDPHASKLERLERLAAQSQLLERISTYHGTLEDYAASTTERFDVVLVDAPCTGLGVIRRHPETRWRRTPEDVAELAELQRRLLETACELVAPGGALVYAVCTFTHEEGPDQIEALLESRDDFRIEPPDYEFWLDPFLDEDNLLRLPPDELDSDGFFAARLVRT